MTKPARPMDELLKAPRLTTSEVLRLACFGRHTLKKRQASKEMPMPIDKGTEDIFDGPTVREKLGLNDNHVEDVWG